MKNKMKQLIGIILSLVLALGLMPVMSTTAYAATKVYTAEQVSIGNLQTGEIIKGNCSIYKNNNKSLQILDEDGTTTLKTYGSSGFTTLSALGYDTIVTQAGNNVIIKKITLVDVTEVTLDQSELTLTVGDTETLTATVSPDDATDKTVTWSSDNTGVATVDSTGKVTAVAGGTATITVTATNGTEDTTDDKTASCTVKAYGATPSITKTDGGTVIVERSTEGGKWNFTAVPDDGYVFIGWGYGGGFRIEDNPLIGIDESEVKYYVAPFYKVCNITYKVVGGTWSDGTTADKTETMTTNECVPPNVPTGMIAAPGYTGGSWDTDPSTSFITEDVIFTYTFVTADSSDSGSGDSSGDTSDSGSGSSSSGSTDSGSGSSSSGGSSDSGNSDTSGGTSDGSTGNTDTNTDTSAKVPYDDVAISTGSVNDITGTAAATAENNPFETKIINNSDEELKTLFSLLDTDVAQGVNVWLDIQDMSASVPQTDKTLIQNTSGDYTVGLYLDINLFKKVGSDDATKVTETNGKVKVSIVIPESLWKSGRTFEVIRVHDGVATAIAGTYDENTHVFTFETDKFSTYALAYIDSASSSDSGTTVPNTGDPNDIRVWYLLLIASLGTLGFLGYSKKKKVTE